MSTNIEWVRNPDGSKGETWPVVTGCSREPTSQGCANCYAARLAATRLKHHPRYAGLAEMQDGKPRWTGEVRLNHDVLGYPASWRKPRRVFVASMGDLFHDNVDDDFLYEVWRTMVQATRHTFLVLTKRVEWMSDFVGLVVETVHDNRPPANIWLGVTIENQNEMQRLEHLINTPAAVRFVSHEPLLSEIDYGAFPIGPRDASYGKSALELGLIHWLIVGGETGPNARPMHPDWARMLRDQCQDAGVPFFFKQWGAWALGAHDRTGKIRNHGHFCADGKWINRSQAKDTAVFISRAGKRTGRLLDGREWNEMP